MNLMPFIAEKLDVRIGEKFNIAGCKDDFVLSDDGNVYLITKDKSYIPSTITLKRLLSGEYTVASKPYIPLAGDEYYTISFFDNNKDNIKIINGVWGNTCIDAMRSYFDIVYRSKEKAEQDKYNAFKRVMGY